MGHTSSRPDIPYRSEVSNDQRHSLPEVKAAQARTAVGRWALVKMALGTVFLVGAMAHSMGPEPRSAQSAMATFLLLGLSTVYVGLALRGFSQARQRGRRLWMALTVAWGVLGAVMLRILTTGR